MGGETTNIPQTSKTDDSSINKNTNSELQVKGHENAGNGDVPVHDGTDLSYKSGNAGEYLEGGGNGFSSAGFSSTPGQDYLYFDDFSDGNYKSNRGTYTDDRDLLLYDPRKDKLYYQTVETGISVNYPEWTASGTNGVNGNNDFDVSNGNAHIPATLLRPYKVKEIEWDMKANGSGGDNATINPWREDGNNRVEMSIDGDIDNYTFTLHENGGTTTIGSGGANNNWNTWKITHDGSKWRVFLNGSQIESLNDSFVPDVDGAKVMDINGGMDGSNEFLFNNIKVRYYRS